MGTDVVNPVNLLQRDLDDPDGLWDSTLSKPLAHHQSDPETEMLCMFLFTSADDVEPVEH